ncbi:MAG: type 4a pilus biogenesis protein PilO [Acidobacteria bacterium]|nr:type 4a pilus biogenesis protein PilO [Acidobacteriota bacterium]
MNLNLSRLPWYGQIGAFVALALVGVGAFWYAYARPAEAGLTTRRAQLATLRAEIDRGLATVGRLPEFRRELADLQAQLDRLRVVLPEERDVGDLLRRVQAMATQSNLTILGFTPQAVTTRELHAEWPIGLQLEGTYHNLGTFLERISRFPRIINVNSISIETRDNPTSTATITAECTATTFVLIEPPADAAGRGRGAAPGRGRGAGAAGGRG